VSQSFSRDSLSRIDFVSEKKSMEIEIRPASPDDVAALRELFFAARIAAFFWAVPDLLQREDFDAATQDEPILVAVLNEQIVGFVSWWPPENFIHNLFVDPTHQGRGIGPQLLTAALRQIGRPATLKCVQKNVRALAFYRRHGWLIAGEGDTAGEPYYLLRL
jgi:ribosomal protein S18 acetylase RimI-like enzyme